MNNPEINLGLVGATGLVGEAVLDILEERDINIGELRPFASESSAGDTIEYDDDELVLRYANTPDSFHGLDYVIVSAGGDATKTRVSKEVIPMIVEAGAIAIDNSSAFRDDPEVPLVVSEVNPEALENIPKGIVANPNCTTMIGMVAVYPLHAKFGLESLSVNTYQSVSGQGLKGIEEFLGQMSDMTPHAYKLVGGEMPEDDFPPSDTFPTVLPYNIGPVCGTLHNPAFDAVDDGTSEEHKFERESRKILGLSQLPVSATCVRVPVLNGHSLSIDASFTEPVKPHHAVKVLRESPGVQLCTAPQPIYSAGKDDVQVGRIRKDPTRENGLKMFVSGDNLRKGAALNAVQILELLANK